MAPPLPGDAGPGRRRGEDRVVTLGGGRGGAEGCVGVPAQPSFEQVRRDQHGGTSGIVAQSGQHLGHGGVGHVHGRRYGSLVRHLCVLERGMGHVEPGGAGVVGPFPVPHLHTDVGDLRVPSGEVAVPAPERPLEVGQPAGECVASSVTRSA